MLNIKKIILPIGIMIIAAGCTINSGEETGAISETKSNTVRAAVMVTHGFHGEETYIPMGYLSNKGVEITVIGPKTGRVESWDKIYNIEIEKAISDVSPDDFDVLIIPGGSSPARMKDVPEAVDFTIDFYNSGRTVASICHGPQLLAATGILNGVNATGVSDIQEELEAAGAIYIDEAVVTHSNLITSRDPDDIPSFIVAIEEALLYDNQ